MAANTENKEQQHPLYKRDRALVESLIAVTDPTDYNLAELARLQIRYRGFPGARDIQADLTKIMQSWGLTETTLYETTRQLHAKGSIYQGRANKGEEDWS